MRKRMNVGMVVLMLCALDFLSSQALYAELDNEEVRNPGARFQNLQTVPQQQIEGYVNGNGMGMAKPADLRFVHLNAHIEQKRLLTETQIKQYDQLRGYEGAGKGGAQQSHSGTHHHHE